jgi:hypothetical protein
MAPSYDVIYPKEILQRIRLWSVLARDLGCGPDYLASLKSMKFQLETEPLEWGDPLSLYLNIDGILCRGMINGWFLVWYGIHRPSHTVIVRELALASGCPLQESLEGS